MGTHPSRPSLVAPAKTSLSDHLKDHPELLGEKVQNKYGKELPFLFKVLAIRKALSVQAHPDKKLAQRLHHEKPDIYKGVWISTTLHSARLKLTRFYVDPNHKVNSRPLIFLSSTVYLTPPVARDGHCLDRILWLLRIPPPARDFRLSL
jgi:mannose-6-phosphate isomerase class I